MSSALQTESTKLRNEHSTIHVKRTRINNILIFNIFKIKWPKSEEKINFRGRWVWLSESSPTQTVPLTVSCGSCELQDVRAEPPHAKAVVPGLSPGYACGTVSSVTAWPWPHLCRPAAAASGQLNKVVPVTTFKSRNVLLTKISFAMFLVIDLRMYLPHYYLQVAEANVNGPLQWVVYVCSAFRLRFAQ